jgi:hypothetical protein
MTPEEIAESQATWQEQRDAADAEKNFAADHLTQEQRDAIEFAYKAVRDAENNMREMFDLTMDNARALDTSEWKLRSAFPAIAEGS